jgi:hypothetical protein
MLHETVSRYMSTRVCFQWSRSCSRLAYLKTPVSMETSAKSLRGWLIICYVLICDIKTSEAWFASEIWQVFSADRFKGWKLVILMRIFSGFSAVDWTVLAANRAHAHIYVASCHWCAVCIQIDRDVIHVCVLCLWVCCVCVVCVLCVCVTYSCHFEFGVV